VVNNDGGAIFSLLEQGSDGDSATFERVFGTPHGVDLAAWCGATQTPFTRVSDSVEALTAALDPRGGLEVVEVRTCRSDVRVMQASLAAAVEAGLG
jgi:2-succinyl-5-enolpyruvyl-6-hydroxy-3-cyclohexene-1-carboxylate synthase